MKRENGYDWGIQGLRSGSVPKRTDLVRVVFTMSARYTWVVVKVMVPFWIL